MEKERIPLNHSAFDDKNTKKTKCHILLIYAVSYLVGAIAFRLIVFHYGKSLVNIYDAKDQYLPFLKYLNLYYRELLRNLLRGRFYLKMFDYSLGFGMDPIRALSYYGLADPLSLPVVFFRQTNILPYYQFIVQFRPFLAGVSFIGMCFHFRKINYTVPFCALFYLCSGWALYASSVHPFFINFLILLPMTIAGIDKILYRKSSALFIVSVFLAGGIGFYFLFMVSSTMLIFAIVRLICRRREILCIRKKNAQSTSNSLPDEKQESPDDGSNRRYSEDSAASMAAEAVKIVLKSLGFYLIGLAMSCFILLPSLLGVMDSLRGASSNLLENMFVYPFPTLEKLYSRAVLISPSCDSLGFSAIGLFCIVAALSKRRKDETGVLALIGIILWFSPAWSVFMSGIALPNYRWFFALSLLIMYLCTDITEYCDKASLLQMIIFVIAGAAAIAASFADYQSGTSFSIIRMLTCAVGMVLLILSRKHFGKSVRRAACIVLICIQCIVNTVAFLSPLWFDKVHEYTDRNVEKRIDHSPFAIIKNDPDYDPLYRTVLGGGNVYNTASVLQIPSPHTYASIIPESVSRFVVETENNMMTTPFSVFGLDRRGALMQMCSVQNYITTPEDTDGAPFGYDGGYEDGDRKVYHNRFAPAPGYMYYKTFDSVDIDRKNGIEKQSLMLQGAVVKNPTIPVMPIDSVETGVSKIPFTVTAQHGISISEGTLSIDENVEDPWMDVSLTIPEYSEIYVRFKDFDAGQRLVVHFVREDGTKKTFLARDRYWAYGQKDFSALIDTTSNGGDREGRYQMHLSGTHECRLDELEFYAYDMKNYEKAARALAKDCMQEIEIGINSISGRVSPKEEGILCVPVPYSKGWSVFVDGEKKDCLQANYLCIAVVVPEGEHEVIFRYMTPGLIPGAVVSVAGIILFLIICNQKRITRKTNGSGR